MNTTEKVMYRWHVVPGTERHGFGCADGFVVQHITPGLTSSKWYATRDEADVALEAMRANGTCRECGDVLRIDYEEGTKREIIDKQVCIGCLVWLEIVAARNNPTHVVVDGDRYHIADEKAGKHFRGFGGSRFYIRFHDGREVVTTNLWSSGTVPPFFRDRLPDNAVFVKEGVSR